MDAAGLQSPARSPGEKHLEIKGYVQLHEARQQHSPPEVDNIFTLLHKGTSPHRVRTRPDHATTSYPPKPEPEPPADQLRSHKQSNKRKDEPVAASPRPPASSPRRLPLPAPEPRRARSVTPTRARSPRRPPKADPPLALSHDIELAMIEKLVGALSSATPSSLAKVSVDELVRIQHILKRHGYSLTPGTRSPLKVTRLRSPAHQQQASSRAPQERRGNPRTPTPPVRIPSSPAAAAQHQPATRFTAAMLDAALHGKHAPFAKASLFDDPHQHPAKQQRPGSSPGAFVGPRAASPRAHPPSPCKEKRARRSPSNRRQPPAAAQPGSAAGRHQQRHQGSFSAAKRGDDVADAGDRTFAVPPGSLAGLSMEQMQGYAAGFLDGRSHVLQGGEGAAAAPRPPPRLQVMHSGVQVGPGAAAGLGLRSAPGLSKDTQTGAGLPRYDVHESCFAVSAYDRETESYLIPVAHAGIQTCGTEDSTAPHLHRDSCAAPPSADAAVQCELLPQPGRPSSQALLQKLAQVHQITEQNLQRTRTRAAAYPHLTPAAVLPPPDEGPHSVPFLNTPGYSQAAGSWAPDAPVSPPTELPAERQPGAATTRDETTPALASTGIAAHVTTGVRSSERHPGGAADAARRAVMQPLRLGLYEAASSSGAPPAATPPLSPRKADAAGELAAPETAAPPAAPPASPAADTNPAVPWPEDASPSMASSSDPVKRRVALAKQPSAASPSPPSGLPAADDSSAVHTPTAATTHHEGLPPAVPASGPTVAPPINPSPGPVRAEGPAGPAPTVELDPTSAASALQRQAPPDPPAPLPHRHNHPPPPPPESLPTPASSRTTVEEAPSAGAPSATGADGAPADTTAFPAGAGRGAAAAAAAAAEATSTRADSTPSRPNATPRSAASPVLTAAKATPQPTAPTETSAPPTTPAPTSEAAAAPPQPAKSNSKSQLKALEPLLLDLRTLKAGITAAAPDAGKVAHLDDKLQQLEVTKDSLGARLGSTHPITLQLTALHSDFAKWRATIKEPPASSGVPPKDLPPGSLAPEPEITEDTTSCNSSISIVSFFTPAASHSQPGGTSLPLTTNMLLGEPRGVHKTQSEVASSFSFPLSSVTEQPAPPPSTSMKHHLVPPGVTAALPFYGMDQQAPGALPGYAPPLPPTASTSSAGAAGGMDGARLARLHVATPSLPQAFAGQPLADAALQGQASLVSLPDSPSSQVSLSPTSGRAEKSKSIWSRMKHGIKRTASGSKTEF